MINRLIATVAVEKTFFNFDSDYDYYVPEELKSAVSIGTRVKVPFGKGNVLRYGIVVKLFEAINGGLKEISSVSSKTPVLSDEMVALALWLKERCFCTTYECLKQMLPRGIDKVGDKSTRMIRLLYENEESLPKLTPKQKAVVNLLFDVGAASVHEVCEFCSVGEGVVKNLVKYESVKFTIKKFIVCLIMFIKKADTKLKLNFPNSREVLMPCIPKCLKTAVEQGFYTA